MRYVVGDDRARAINTRVTSIFVGECVGNAGMYDHILKPLAQAGSFRSHAHAQVSSASNPSVERFFRYIKGMVGSPGVTHDFFLKWGLPFEVHALGDGRKVLTGRFPRRRKPFVAARCSVPKTSKSAIRAATQPSHEPLAGNNCRSGAAANRGARLERAIATSCCRHRPVDPKSRVQLGDFALTQG